MADYVNWRLQVLVVSVALAAACSASSLGWAGAGAAPQHFFYQYDAPRRGYTYEYSVPIMPQRLLPPPPPLLPVGGPCVTKTVYVVVERPGDEQELFDDIPALLELIGEGQGPGPVMAPGPAPPPGLPALMPAPGPGRPSEQPTFMFNSESGANAWPAQPEGPDVKGVAAAAAPAENSDALEYEGDTATDSAAMANHDGGGLIDIRSGRAIQWRQP